MYSGLQLLFLAAICLHRARGHIVLTDPLLNVVGTMSGSCLMKEGRFSCQDHSECITFDLLCNGQKDCGDSSDEGGRCQDQCLANKQCSYKCQRTPQGPYCLCPVGWELLRDNSTCADVDECAQWPPICDQQCVNSLGSFTCSCAAGYALDDDQIHCHAQDETPGSLFLVYTEGPSIKKLLLGHGAVATPTLIHQDRHPIFAIALDTHEEKVFWFSSDDNEVKSIGVSEDFNKNSIQRVIKNGLSSLVSTMSYDWMAKNLYMGDLALHRIIVCSLKTDFCLPLFTSADIHLPWSLIVDPPNGMFYWSECGNSRRIQSASLDGSNAKTVTLEQPMKCATSLFLDVPMRTLYWSDPDLHLVESISVDAKPKRRNLTSKFVPNPVSVVIYEEDVFIVHVSSMQPGAKINLAYSNKFDYETQHEPMSVSLSEIPSDMKVYQRATQVMPERNPCLISPCSDICLLNDQGGYTCACPAGKRLDERRHSCIWNWNEPSLLIASASRLHRVLPDAVGSASHEVLHASPEHNITAVAFDSYSQTIFFADASRVSSGASNFAISSFRLDETAEIKQMIEDVGFVTDIAIDYISKNIYWTDSHRGVIEVSRMDGSYRMTLLDNTVLEEPHSVAVDAVGSKLYYSDCGQAPHVGVCNLDGKNCYVKKMKAPMRCITDLFLDTRDNRLYYTDTSLGAVSFEDLSSAETVQIRHSPEPLSVVVTQDNLFWIDRHYSDVLRQPKTDSYHDSHIKLQLKPITALVSLDNYAQPSGSNGCSHNYGGCSHICISTNRMHVSCLCPANHYLSSDMMTCVNENADAVFVTPVRPTVTRRGGGTKKYHRPTPATTDDYRCPQNQCLNQGKCSYDDGEYVCLCNGDWSGDRCENAPGYVRPTRGWIVALVVVLCLVAIVVVGLVLFFRTHSQLHPGDVFRFARLKSTLLENKAKDSNRQALIEPTYTEIIQPTPEIIDINSDMNDLEEHNISKMRNLKRISPPPHYDNLSRTGSMNRDFP